MWGRLLAVVFFVAACVGLYVQLGSYEPPKPREVHISYVEPQRPGQLQWKSIVCYRRYVNGELTDCLP